MRVAERAIGAALIAIPWLAFLLPAPTLLVASFDGLIVAAAAVHGFGRGLAIAFNGGPPTRRPTIDALCLGAAVVVLLGGALAALHRFDHAAQLGLLVVGLALHAFAVVHGQRDADLVARARTAVAGVDALAVLLWITLAALLALHVLGLLASQHTSVFDDDGHWYAAVARMRDTGRFGDPIGYARAFQLGGSVIASVLSATITDVHVTRVAEALGFILTFVGLARLALSADDRRQAGALIFLLLALALSSKAQAEFDATLFWLPSALFVAVFRHLIASRRTPGRGDGVWLVLLLAGAVAIRLEYLPFAVALAFGAPGGRGERYRRAGMLVGGIALCLLPMLLAWHPRGIVPLAAGLVVGAVGLLFPRPRTALGLFTIAVALDALVVFLVPTPAGEMSGRVLWVPIFALLHVTLAALAQSQWAPRSHLDDLRNAASVRGRFRFWVAGVLLLATLAFIMRAQDFTVRMSWRTRFRMWIQDAAELAVAAPVAPPDPYAALLARVPPGAKVLAWIDHPERVDFAAHDLVDLRFPRQRALHTVSWGTPSPLIASFAKRSGATYLLYEPDMLEHQHTKESFLYGLWCTAGNPFADPVLGRSSLCADPLEQALLAHRVVANLDGISLIDLTRER